MLVKKKRSVKRKAQAPPESSLAIRGKVLRLRASSLLLTAKDWGSSHQVPTKGQAPPPMAEVSKVVSLKNRSGKSAEPPLEVMSIYVRSRLVQNSKLPLTTLEDEGRDCFSIEGDEDNELTNSEVAIGVVSSILRDFDLKRADAMSVEEALALLLQGGPSYVQTPLFVRPIFDVDWPLPLSCFFRWLPT